MNMIEKMAQAIIDVRIARDLQGLPQSLEQEVRAAIAAMRKPTEEMVEAGDAEFPEEIDGISSLVWERMIDTALKEET